MEFIKCINLNRLVKTKGARTNDRFDAVSVEFNMFRLGCWAAEVRFPALMFDREMQDFIGWALANTRSHFIGGSNDEVVLFLQ